MIGTLVKIRWWQLRRQFRQAGIIYTSLLILAVMLLEGALYSLLEKSAYAPYLAAGLVFSVIGIHWYRKDKAFIWKHLPFPKSNIFCEYLIGTLPITLLFFLQGKGYYFPLLMFCFWTIAQLKTGRATPRRWLRLPSILPARQFEWVAGLRQQSFLIALLFVAALATVWIRFLPLLFLWFLTIVLTGFYQQGEPLQLLYARYHSARQLIRTKLWEHGKITLMVLAPVLIVHSLFFPGLTAVNVIFLLLMLTLHFLAILIKYATYEPEANLKGNSLMLSICATLIVIPVAFVIPALLAIRYYGRASRHLNQYF